MNYIEVRIPKPNDETKSEILIFDLAGIGFESFSEEESVILAYIPEKDFQQEMLMTIAYCELLLNKNEIDIKLIEDQNWNAVWESNYPPVMIANCCFIRAPFHDPDPEAEFNILLRPKMAFGTAHHETTALMIETLLDEDVKGKTVLDMGCGTSVLAILASLKGASGIKAIDNDHWAYENSLENVEINGIANIEVLEGDAKDLPTDPVFDLVIANINKNILLRDLNTYAPTLKNGGSIYLSGFYSDDLDDIKNEARKNGLVFVSVKTKNNWAAAVFKKQ